MIGNRRTLSIPKLREKAPLAGLLLVSCSLFSEAVLKGQVFWQRDIGFYWYPQVEAFVRIVSQGVLPLWNPYVSFGLPLLADPSYQVLYPFTWLNLVLLPATYYKAYVVFHLAAGGVGLFLLARRWGLGRVPAFVAGAVWMTSGPLLVVVSHTHHFAGTAWLPWVLLALVGALDSGRPRAGVVLGAVVAGQVFAGSGDLCLMTAFAGLGYGLTFVLAGPGSVAVRVRRVGLMTAVAGPVGGLLSAPQWLSTVAVLSSGQRLQLGPALKMAWSLHPASLVDLFVPRLVSDLPVNAAARGALFEGREPLFGCIYVGAAAAAIVASSLALPWNRFRAFSGIGFVLSILAALGRHTVFYPWMLQVTPLFLFRYPAKYVILAGFFWAALAGFAVEDWMRPGGSAALRFRWRVGLLLATLSALGLWLGCLLAPAGPRIIVDALESTAGQSGSGVLVVVAAKLAVAATMASLVVLLAWLRGRRQGRGLALVAATLALADLWWVGRSINPLAPPELMTHRPPVLAQVRPGARLWASLTGAPDWRDRVRGPIGWKREWSWARGVQDLVRPPTGARWGLCGAYDGDSTGLAPPLLANMTLVLQNATDPVLAARVLQMGGVDFVVSMEPRWPLVPVAEYPSAFPAPIRLYRVPDSLPRAYVVGMTRVAPEPYSVEAIADPGLDPAREVIVPPGAPAITPRPGFQGRLWELWRRADSVGLETEANGAAYAVVLDAFYPGWRAWVDGQRTEIVRANVLFRAVPVPEGRHTVVFEYRPASAAWGVGLGVAGVVLGIAIWRFPRGNAFGRFDPDAPTS